MSMATLRMPMRACILLFGSFAPKSSTLPKMLWKWLVLWLSVDGMMASLPSVASAKGWVRQVPRCGTLIKQPWNHICQRRRHEDLNLQLTAQFNEVKKKLETYSTACKDTEVPCLSLKKKQSIGQKLVRAKLKVQVLSANEICRTNI